MLQYFDRTARAAVIENLRAEPPRLERAQIHRRIQTNVIGPNHGRITVSHQHIANCELSDKLLVIGRFGDPADRKSTLTAWRQKKMRALGAKILDPIEIMMVRRKLDELR